MVQVGSSHSDREYCVKLSGGRYDFLTFVTNISFIPYSNTVLHWSESTVNPTQWKLPLLSCYVAKWTDILTLSFYNTIIVLTCWDAWFVFFDVLFCGESSSRREGEEEKEKKQLEKEKKQQEKEKSSRKERIEKQERKGEEVERWD